MDRVAGGRQQGVQGGPAAAGARVACQAELRLLPPTHCPALQQPSPGRRPRTRPTTHHPITRLPTCCTKASTWPSRTSDTVQPPQPAPVRREPMAPAALLTCGRAGGAGSCCGPGGARRLLASGRRWQAGGHAAGTAHPTPALHPPSAPCNQPSALHPPAPAGPARGRSTGRGRGRRRGWRPSAPPAAPASPRCSAARCCTRPCARQVGGRVAQAGTRAGWPASRSAARRFAWGPGTAMAQAGAAAARQRPCARPRT